MARGASARRRKQQGQVRQVDEPLDEDSDDDPSGRALRDVNGNVIKCYVTYSEVSEPWPWSLWTRSTPEWRYNERTYQPKNKGGDEGDEQLNLSLRMWRESLQVLVGVYWSFPAGADHAVFRFILFSFLLSYFKDFVGSMVWASILEIIIGISQFCDILSKGIRMKFLVGEVGSETERVVVMEDEQNPWKRNARDTYPRPISSAMDVHPALRHAAACRSVRELTANSASLISADCTRLKTLPRWIGALTTLQKLDLSACVWLTDLPKELNALTALQKLHLGGCSRLQEVDESLLCSLTLLQELYLVGCSGLSTLPNSVRSLKALKKLNVQGCSLLSRLPESLGALMSLETLVAASCKGLETLPESLGELTALRTLNLQACVKLKALPSSLGKLGALEVLNMKDCVRLSGLPNSLEGLTALRALHLGGCVQLQRLSESLVALEALQVLVLYGCRALDKKEAHLWGASIILA